MGKRLLLGLGGTVDYELEWNVPALESMVVEFGVDPKELDRAVEIVDERTLLISVLAYAQSGTGGERFVASSEVIETFARRFSKRVTLGGTPVRAAMALDARGFASTVHLVSIDDTVRALLPKRVDYVSSATADSTDPHLIVQYPAGTRIRCGGQTIVAPQANRIIYVNDPPNRNLEISPDLAGLVHDAGVFLLSGFNAIQDPEIMEERLETVASLVAAAPPTAVVMFEDAGYPEARFSTWVRDSLAPLVDVYSLNEDELAAYTGSEIDLLDPDAIESALRSLAVLIPTGCLVVHTKDWCAILGRDSGRFAVALEEGMLTAAARYLFGDGAGPTELGRVRELPRRAVCVRFATDLERRFAGRLVFLPAYELVTDRPTTIGLGDSFVGGFIAALAADHDDDALFGGWGLARRRQHEPGPRPREGSST